MRWTHLFYQKAVRRALAWVTCVSMHCLCDKTATNIL